MDQSDSISLLQHLRSGDQRAAEEIYERYMQRLLALANSRLSLNLRRKVDADDIVQSAMNSFYRGAKEGRFDLRRSGDLWRLLAKITLNKLLKKAEYYAADKRSAKMEQFLERDEASDVEGQFPPDSLPPPDELAALSEELEFVTRDLSASHREAIFLRLRGESVATIAQRLDVTERQIRRILQKAEAQLLERLTSVG
jgi:RNA polymerase sigma factor (sigma-70 family)